MPDPNSSLPEFSYQSDARITDISVTDQEVLRELKCLQANKATGPDGIGNIVLKSVAPSIYHHLAKLYNFSLASCTFPDQWKMAHVCPVHKKGNNHLVENYRPISLLVNLSKVFEKLIHCRIYTFLTSNNLLIENNSGFKKGDSTEIKYQGHWTKVMMLG